MLFGKLKRQLNELAAARAVSNQSADFWMTPTEWKGLLDETISPILNQEFGLKYMGGYIWAGDWENHRRKVVRIFLMNNSGGTLQWGWCFDFVPHPSGKDLKYNRTDKSIMLHLWNIPEGFIYGEAGSSERASTLLLAYGANKSQVAEACKKVCTHLLPDIKTYFRQQNSYANLEEELHWKIDDAYYSFVDGVQFRITYAFILAASGRKELAKQILSPLEYREGYEALESKLLLKVSQQELLLPPI